MSFEYVPIDQVAATIQDDLGFNTDKEYSRMMRWIYQAIWETNGARIVLKQKVLDISDLRIQKPDDFIVLSNLYLKDGDACREPKFKPSVNCCRHYPVGSLCSEIEVSESAECFTFSSNISGQYTQALLIYYTMPTDENGKFLVPQVLMEAIWAYVNYKWLSRNRRRQIDSPPQKKTVPQSELANTRAVWIAEMRAARAQMMSPKSYQEIRQIGNDYLYLITNRFPADLNMHLRSYFTNA